MASNGYNYKTIKSTAKDMGLTIDDLLALAPKNDPFYCGTPTELAKARWFAEAWHKLGFTNGVHLRRIHYRLVTDPEAVKHDGKPYENTSNSWSYLCEAGKYARYLGLIDPFAFEDRRNPDPHIRGGAYPDHAYPRITFDNSWDDWHLPKIKTNLGSGLNWYIPSPQVEGYEYNGIIDQPYHLEVWVEKTTLEGDIKPVCDRLGITYLAGPGFQSITRVVGMVNRVKTYGKPSVIFYISDFDPAGDIMPVAVARQIEYWSHKLEAGVNIKLQPIALTRDQVINYQLPRIPIKSSDVRKQDFEDRRGEGAVELDALEALYPGEIAKILESEALPYRDLELSHNLYNADYEATQTVSWEWDQANQDNSDKLGELKSQANEIYNKYRERLDALSQELDQELAPLEAELKDLRHAVSDKIDQFDPELDDRPRPVTQPPDDWIMFDTSRGYLSQIEAYQRYKDPMA